MLAELINISTRDRSGAMGGAVDSAVVNTHECSVRGQPDVTLESLCAIGDGPQVRGERVFGLKVGRPTVRDDFRARGAHATIVRG